MLSDDITVKQVIADKTEKDIDEVRACAQKARMEIVSQFSAHGVLSVSFHRALSYFKRNEVRGCLH